MKKHSIIAACVVTLLSAVSSLTTGCLNMGAFEMPVSVVLDAVFLPLNAYICLSSEWTELEWDWGQSPLIFRGRERFFWREVVC